MGDEAALLREIWSLLYQPSTLELDNADRLWELVTASEYIIDSTQPNSAQHPINLEDWRITMLPGNLLETNIDRLVVAESAYQQLNPHQQLYVLGLPYYEPIIETANIRLYRPIADGSASTFGLLSDDFVIARASIQPLEFEPDAVVLNPTERALTYAPYALYALAATDYAKDGALRHPEVFYTLMNVVTRLVRPSELALDADQTAAFQRWEQTRNSADLAAAGINYLIFDAFWTHSLSEGERLTLLNPQHYEQVPGWEFIFFDEVHHLYRVLPSGLESSTQKQQ
ncbi:MAG: hypothetical protein HC915_03400 [Anaerolineae bacterium]|nr:hypothetical protein [Anaerolineae bacterium]